MWLLPSTQQPKQILGDRPTRLLSQFSRTMLMLSILLAGCTTTNPTPPASNKPAIVSTSTMIADWTQQVGGDEIQPTSILKPGDDPHVYEPTPADTQALETASAIFYNGYNLEPGLIRLINSAGSKARRVAVGEVIKPLQLNKPGKGNVPDPHVWGDVKNAIQMVNRIRDELIQLSPEDKDLFMRNATQLIAELEYLDRWIDQQVQTIPPEQRKLVTTHDAFQYYGKAYGLELAGTLIGISTEEQPSAQTVRQLADRLKASKVPAIFAETTINPTLIQTVAQEAGVKLAPQKLYSDSVGAPGSKAETYTKMMVANTEAIVTALGGRVTPFVAKP